MKTKFKYVTLVAVALLMGLGSCKNGDDVVPGQDPDEGALTYATIKLSTTGTYATQTGTTSENKINSVDVFIYNQFGDLLKHENFTPFVNDGTAKVQTTGGIKQVFLGVNLPAALANDLSTVNTKVTALTSVAQTLNLATVANTNAFIMTSDVVSKKFESWDGTAGTIPAANVLNMKVYRLASKFVVEKTDAFDLTQTIDGGTFNSTLSQFALGQVNTKGYIARKILAGDYLEDPNYADPTASGELIALTAGTFGTLAVNDKAGPADLNTLNCLYTTENTNNNAVARNLTYACVKLQFKPTQFDVKTGSVWGKANNPNTMGEDFYCIKTSAGNLYFGSLADANTYITDHVALSGATVLRYTNGNCYYMLYVNKVKIYDVDRNDFYRLKLGKVYGLGHNEPTPKDPEEVIESNTDVAVTIEIVPWNLIEEDHPLVP